jgi:ATP-dependent RNA helicase SUPV3L1/SUV3
VPVDIEEPAADAAALETIPEAPAPGEPLERAGDPAPAEAAEALVSVPEGSAIALTGETEQIEAVTQAPDSSAPMQAPEAASETDVKTDLAPTEFIEVWRPGRRDDHARKPRHESGPRQRRPQRQRHTPPPAAASDGVPVVAVAEGTPPPAAGDAGAETAPDQRRDGGRHRARPADAERPERPERQPRPDQRPDRRVRAERPGGPEHERGQRGGGRPPPRGDRPDRDPTLRAKYIKGRGEGRDRRDREPDPNSPFAKLAALKEQLEANAKEPR